jgi:hypothetical protein
METLFVLVSGVLLMISAILGEQLSKKLRITIWILFVTLLISYTYINIEMENKRNIEKGKDDTKISDLTNINKQMLAINKELLEVVKAPDFGKNPETLSKIDEIKGNLSSIENKPKAVLRFIFWPPEPQRHPIDKLNVIIKNGIVEVPFSFKNISTEPAKNGEVWIQICDSCRFAEETVGLEKVKPHVDTIRRKPFCIFNPGVYFTPATLKIIPPLWSHSFYINFKYACETCPLVDNEHPQKLTVNY